MQKAENNQDNSNNAEIVNLNIKDINSEGN